MLKDWKKPRMPEEAEIRERIKAAREKLELRQLQLKERDLPVIVLLEGWGAAGKGSLIGKLIIKIAPSVIKGQVENPDMTTMLMLMQGMKELPLRGLIGISGGIADIKVIRGMMEWGNKHRLKGLCLIIAGLFSTLGNVSRQKVEKALKRDERKAAREEAAKAKAEAKAKAAEEEARAKAAKAARKEKAKAEKEEAKASAPSMRERFSSFFSNDDKKDDNNKKAGN